MKKLICTLALASVVVGCGSSNTQSSANSIGTNLNEDGTKDTPTYLYWVSGDSAFQGTCNPDEVAVLHANCENDVNEMGYEDFKVALDNGLSDTIVELEHQVVVIQKTIKDLEFELAATKKELAETVAETEETRRALAEKREEMEMLEDFVAEYRQQLEWIAEELDQYKDADLAEMHDVIAAELEQTRQRLGEVYKNVKQLTDRIEELCAEIKELGFKIAEIVVTIVDLNKQLEATLYELAVARDMFKIYKNTLRKLEHRIIFVIKDNTTWFEANRRYVKMFDEIFAAAAAKKF